MINENKEDEIINLIIENKINVEKEKIKQFCISKGGKE
jgi:hypothetical protein